MHFTSEQHLPDGVLERRFALGEIPGILWTPTPAPTSNPTPAPAPAPGSAPAPLILIAHPPLGLARMYPRLAARARHYAVDFGFAAATIELPGSGDRPRWAAIDRARAELRGAMEAGGPVDGGIVDALVLPLVEKAVPEWRAALDALLALPGIDGPVGYDGGVISIGVQLAVEEPRIAAAVLFAGSLVPAAVVEQARRVTVPLQVLLQWDDEGNDRRAALELFDAFGSAEKTLHANLGGHTGVPPYELDAGARFFARHLKH